MKKNRTRWALLAALVMGSCVVARAAAQEPQAAAKADAAVREGGMSARVVKGAPYSAQVTNETIQILSDGNKIDRKTASTVYRDSQGRVRREESVTIAGPYQPNGATTKPIMIEDPVAGVRYELHPDTKIANEVQIVKPGTGFKSTTLNVDGVAVPITTNVIADGTAVTVTGGRGGSGDQPVSPDEPVKESLGSQTIDGLYVTGTRVTRTIPAGQIGNEQPISIVTETWVSPDLQIVVMTKHSDPRMGTTTMQLSNINRNEPAANLFTVPADYTVKTLKPLSMSLTVLKEQE